MPGALPAGGAGRAGSCRGARGAASCREVETIDVFLGSDATKSFVAFGNSVKETIALPFFFFNPQTRERPRSGLFMGSAVLDGTSRCTPRPVFGWVGCEGEANRGPHRAVAQWLPQQ